MLDFRPVKLENKIQYLIKNGSQLKAMEETMTITKDKKKIDFGITRYQLTKLVNQIAQCDYCDLEGESLI